MKCVLKYPKKENTKRPEPTNNFDSGRILSIVTTQHPYGHE